MANSTVCQSKWKPIVEPRRAKSKTYRQAPTHWLKFYEEAVIGSEVRTAVVQNLTKVLDEGLKAPYSWKKRHFFIKDRFNKLIYGINTIIECDTWQPAKFSKSLVF